MTTPLYKATIGAMIRQAEALQAIMAKGREHLGAEADGFIHERLCEDMLPFSFQVRSVHHHTVGMIKALETGKAGPPQPQDVTTYAQLEGLLGEAIDALKAVTPDALEKLLENDVTFAMNDMKIPFTGLGFVSSFELPNFYFHATTAYNLLRRKGVSIGKRDWLGAMELNLG